MDRPAEASVAEFRERLRVPLRWWVLAGLFWGSLLLALLIAMPAVWAVLVVGVLGGATALLLQGFGAAEIRVADGELHAGRARIPATLLGPARALGGDETARQLGVDADARAYLLVRPYVAGSVLVPVDDPDDPTPYWLLSSRRPEALVAVLDRQHG